MKCWHLKLIQIEMSPWKFSTLKCSVVPISSFQLILQLMRSQSFHACKFSIQCLGFKNCLEELSSSCWLVFVLLLMWSYRFQVNFLMGFEHFSSKPILWQDSLTLHHHPQNSQSQVWFQEVFPFFHIVSEGDNKLLSHDCVCLPWCISLHPFC